MIARIRCSPTRWAANCASRSPRRSSGTRLLAVMSAGAYGFVMASNYCSRLRVAEVLVHEDQYDLIRRRDTEEDLVRGEQIPDFLIVGD